MTDPGAHPLQGTSTSMGLVVMVVFLALACVGMAALYAVWQRKRRAATDKGGRGGHTNVLYALEGHPARPSGFGEYAAAHGSDSSLRPVGLVDCKARVPRPPVLPCNPSPRAHGSPGNDSSPLARE